MSFPQRFTTGTVTCNSSGDATAYTTANITGRVLAIQYVKTNFTDGVDFVATGKDSGLAVWTGTNVNASVTVYPVAAATLAGGAASTLTEVGIYLVNEPLKIVVASGGNGTTGTFYVMVV
jgi:hypothetical protein